MAFVDFDVFWSKDHAHWNETRFLSVFLLSFSAQIGEYVFFRKIDRVMFVSNSSAVDRTAYRTGSYGAPVTTRYFHEAKPIKHQNTPSEGVLKTYYGGKNTKMYSKRRVSQLKLKRNTTRQTRNNLGTTGHEDLPELYILVLVSRVRFRWFHKCIRNPAGCLFVLSGFFSTVHRHVFY